MSTPAETIQQYITKLIELNDTLTNLNPRRKHHADSEAYKKSILQLSCLACLTTHMIAVSNLIEAAIAVNIREGYAPQTTAALNLWYAQNEKLMGEVETVYKIKHFGAAV